MITQWQALRKERIVVGEVKMNEAVENYKKYLETLTQSQLYVEWDEVCSVFRELKEKAIQKEQKEKSKVKTSGGKVF